MTILFLIAITFAGLGQPAAACLFSVLAIAASQRHRLHF